jgi:hypothetical protein
MRGPRKNAGALTRVTAITEEELVAKKVAPSEGGFRGGRDAFRV